MLYLLQLSKEKIQSLWPINLGPPIWALTLQTLVSDVTQRDTGLSPAQSPGHPLNPAPPANSGATGKQTVLSTTHQISGSTSGPTTMGQEPDSGRPWHCRPWFPGWSERWSNCAWVIPVTEPKLQTPSPPHTDGLRASGNWHGGQTQSLVSNRHWSGLFTINLL